jgi:protein-tyrosine phosphatase
LNTCLGGEGGITVDLEFRIAELRDVDLVVRLLSAASRWMADAGIDQWPHPFPRDIVAASIERGETHLASEGPELVGSVALLDQDPTWWGPRPPDAVYVHRLVVSSEARGRGIGDQLLDWAQDQATASGRRWLRLDCGAKNVALRRYYERRGFAHVDDVVVNVAGAGSDGEPWHGCLYQRARTGRGRDHS